MKCIQCGKEIKEYEDYIWWGCDGDAVCSTKCEMERDKEILRNLIFAFAPLRV